MSTDSITKQIQELHLNLQILNRNQFMNYDYQYWYYFIAVMISYFLRDGKTFEFLAPANFNLLQFNV